MAKGNLLESEQRDKLIELNSQFESALISGNEERAEEIRQIFEEAKELGLYESLVDLLQRKRFGQDETF